MRRRSRDRRAQMSPPLPQLDALAAVFDGSPDLVCVVDGDGVVRYANPAGQARWQVGAAIRDDAELGPALGDALARGGAARVEWGERGPAGVRCWYACTASPLRGGGWVCVSRDVTEQKRTEERLRRSEQLLVDAQGVAHLGTWEWDVSEPHAYWSAELYRIYGLSPETYTPSYEAYLTMVHPDDRQRVIDATNRVFHEHVPYSHDERIFRPDGTMRHLHTWAYPILDEHGALRRLVGVCQDITERHEAEEQVRRINAELEQRVAERTRQLEASMRDLEAFNAMVSHDLRAPLTTIELATSLLARRAADEQSRGTVDRIHRAVAQMTGLIDDLLALARVGSAPLQRAAIDVSALAHDIVADLRQTSPARVVEVVIEPALTCDADPVLLRAALQNLIGNAWKYTARCAAPRIEVGSSAVDGRRVLVIRDNGAGFDMNDAHRLFAPFQRLHAPSEFAGTGLGLATVRRIVELHGGRVWAEGAPGAGASFYLDVPPAPRSPAPDV